MGKRVVAVFDFDGTLTTKDSFVAFLIFIFGRKKVLLGVALHIHWLILMELHLCSHGKAKQKIFSYFFKGMSYSDFKKYGEAFAKKIIPTILLKNSVEKLKKHLQKGQQVYIVTASIEDWVRPWCIQQGVCSVIATRAEVDDNDCLTGRFQGENCYGEEKVNRFIKIEPHREEYYLYAYGDSRGDKEMLALADEGYLLRGGK